MEALYKKLWISVSPLLQPVIDQFSLHIIEQNVDQHSDNFWSMENNSASYLTGYR
jgi:hypothetical protein